jgi:SecD/SecF fusion protein
VTDRRRNLTVIAIVLALLGAAFAIIASKPTRLGLDLQGGIELIYEGRPTPKVPEVTPQAIDDAIETMRKRTDALGVSEPEIQRAGADQISIGLPDVENAQEAIDQVGDTAQLQFYDWEPNVLGERGPDAPFSGTRGLFEAVELGSKSEPRAEPEDIPPDAPEGMTEEEADRQNDTFGDKYYLFDPNERLIPAGQFEPPLPGERAAAANPATGYYATCKELRENFADRPATGTSAREYPENTECRDELLSLEGKGPPSGSRVLKVPQGIVILQNDRPDDLPSDVAFNQFFVLEDDSELSGTDVENPEQQTDPQSQAPVVTFEFTDRGRKAFQNVTARVAERGLDCSSGIPPEGLSEAAGARCQRGLPQEEYNQRFAITLDNQIVSNATIDFRELPEGIDGRTGAQIEGVGDLTAAQDLAEQLRIGALPIELKLISQTQVSATLGQQALDQGLIAGAAGLALTLLFLIVFYRVLGVVAGLALVIYAILLFALVKLIPITLTLPGIAGLILTLGVAADANIVVFERVKEEVRAGRSIPAAIAGGYAKALKTIIDANVVTIGVAFILFMLATAGVKGFAFTLGIGTLVSLFTAVLATSAILGLMSRSRLLRSRHALGAGEQRRSWRFDYMGASKWFFSMSGAILVVCAVALAGKGIEFGIDFESGTRITAPLQEAASVDDVRDALPGEFSDAKIQEVDDPELGENIVQVAVAELEPEDERIENALDENFGLNRTELNRNSIGPTFGEQIANTAVIAIIASLALISLYIAFRFEWKYAVPVLIAVAHDILITTGVYALVGREVTTSTVAALLTILGFSLYDTIIVFDRIRENVPRMPRAAFSQIVNRSMSEVIVRSLATNVCTLLPVTTLMFFGGETLRDFAFALLVGIASGTYSSIFIASPVLTLWKEREPVYRRRRRLVMEDHGGLVPAYATGVLGDGAGDEEAEPTRPQRRRKPAPAAAATGVPTTGGGYDAVTGGAVPTIPEPPATPEPRPAEQHPPPAGDGGDAADGADQAASVPDSGPRERRKRQRQRKKHGRR